MAAKKEIKIGVLGYATQTGLGYQVKSFVDNIKPSKILVADISKFNNMPILSEWYKDFHTRYTVNGFPTNEDCEWLVDGMDVVFVCENPLNYHLFEYANLKNVKTIQQYNYEFLEYFRNPFLPKPSLLAAPTSWNVEKVKKLGFNNIQFLQVPINIKPKRKNIKKPITFVHIVGRPAAYDRNGTLNFLEAAFILGKKYNYKIFFQSPLEARSKEYFESIKQKITELKKILEGSLQVIENVKNNNDMYKGDVLVMTRRYGGLCLPALEALGHGMPVIMTNISPNYDLLPKEWLVESKLKSIFKTSSDILIYDAMVADLCMKMNSMVKNIAFARQIAEKIANELAWNNQKENYLKTFRKLCES